MSFAERFENVFKRILPSPFTIAIILTILTVGLAYFFTSSKAGENHLINIFGYWEKGLWEQGLMAFAVQMMLMLVLGHSLALTPFFSRLIDRLTNFATTPSNSAWLVCFTTLLVAFFNWGLGLIFGAIIARKVGEKFAREGKKLNYALIGAAGYSGLMVWHGGISGSAPVKAAEQGQVQAMMNGIMSPDEISGLPAQISFDSTVFSSMNITLFFVLIITLPLLMAWLGKRTKATELNLELKQKNIQLAPSLFQGAERLDHSKILCLSVAIIILTYALYIPFSLESFSWNFINPNYINLALLGLCLLLHGSFFNFLKSIDLAIGGASGILIQFPLYFGIMGIMKHSGLIADISAFFISISNSNTFPIFTFFSAGLVNLFVPSGGGQWAIQGPILVQAAESLNASIAKNIMAMAYGDQLTNMLQPFWALPLLGITGLKAKDIIPYTLLLMLAGAIIFIAGLIIF